MSTKTIAVDTRVYEKLARAKRESESFSKTINRLLDRADAAHSAGDVLSALQNLPPLPEPEASRMLDVVRENRTEPWA